ncbi:MXAN_5187 C-terminal domain-containing protein [Trichloromonas sp.]|uniref:MXAN_5187 C-terminal domain-containing protein n=1 Tax=Trichloromonas sp. TaxID=3069249 RepID=UPI003D817264
MDERRAIARELGDVEQDIKDLVILYEQYFAGVEKREPIKPREAVAARLRRFVNRRIIQTDLRFRCQTLAARFHSYSTYWDRILRLIDEGRYIRQVAKAGRTSSPEPVSAPVVDPMDRVYQELLQARRDCSVAGPDPERQQVHSFLERQKEKIRETFGDREVEFRVVTEDGKPKIKVRAKK